MFAAEIGFIDFDFTIQSAHWTWVVVREHGANLLEHAPRRLVGNASLPLNLLRANSASRGCHEIDGIEPSGERRGRLVEDSASSRVNMMAALVARVRRATLHAMMLGGRFALLAVDSLWVKVLAQPLKAGHIIGEHFLEVLECKRLHLWFAIVMGHLITYSQVKSYQIPLPTVKG
jgi:hypothetical protein